MFRLIWKEWHEQRWKLAFGCLVLGALALIGLRTRVTDDQAMMMSVCFIGVTLLPVLSNTGLVPAERADQTLGSLLALPVAPWRILAVKTIVGILLVAGPILTAALLSLWVAGGREIPGDAIVLLYVHSILAAVSLFIWMHALTIHLPSEARAGLVSLGLLILWMLATAGLAEPATPSWMFGISPLAFVYGIAAIKDDAPPLTVIVTIQAAILGVLWIWASRQLTTPSEAMP